MLQQTQVATVVPYYERFLRAFPSISRLAAAPLERALELWSGLGYYRRARHLYWAAQAIDQKFAGRFPRNYQQARALPGIGDYTARAVLSIAYGLPYAVLDGNVARVMARLRALKGNLHRPPFRHAVEQDLACLLSRRDPGSFNQALMELGQTICLPRLPRCPVCPLRRWCQAYRRGNQHNYPAARSRRRTEIRYLATAVIRRGRKVLMVRGLDEGLLDDLWNFPATFGRSQVDALARLRAKLDGMAPERARVGEPVAEVRHGITYRSIRVHVCPAEISGGMSTDLIRWFPLDQLPRAAVSQLARKIAARIASAPQ